MAGKRILLARAEVNMIAADAYTLQMTSCLIPAEYGS